MRKFNEQVGFGKLSVKDAAKAMHAELTDTLERGDWEHITMLAREAAALPRKD